MLTVEQMQRSKTFRANWWEITPSKQPVLKLCFEVAVYKDHYKLSLRSSDIEADDEFTHLSRQVYTKLLNELICLARLNPSCYYLELEPSSRAWDLLIEMGFTVSPKRRSLLRFTV